MILTAIVFLASTITQAASVNSERIEIKPSSVDKIIRLVEKVIPGSSEKKLSIIVTDAGMQTDVSPRYSVYLGYQSNAEMGNLSADFKLSDQFMSVSSARRVSAGIYEVTGDQYTSGVSSKNVTLRIDATKMFADEAAARKACGDDFCDIEQLQTTIEVTSK